MTKRFNLLFVSVLFLQVGSVSAQGTVWEAYGKRGRIQYKHFHEIDFEKTSLEKVSVPDGLSADIAEAEARYARPSSQLAEQKKQFEQKIQIFLKQHGLETDEQLSKLSAAEILKKTSDIVTTNIYYQFVRSKEGLSEMEKSVWKGSDGSVEITEIEPESMDCFLIGCGVCLDYAETFTNVFNWFKKKNIPSLRNVFVVSIADDDYTDSEQDYAKKTFLVSMGIEMDKTNAHVWNAVIVLDPDYLTYSFFDVGGVYHQYGRFDEAILGQQLSQFESRNLARLYEAVGEYQRAYDYFEKSHAQVLSLRKKGSDMETTLYLAKTAERLKKYDTAFTFYSRVSRHRNDKALEAKVAQMAYKIGNYALSLNRFQNLFLKGEDEKKEIQIEYLHGIYMSLTRVGTQSEFERYLTIAHERKLPYRSTRHLLKDMVAYTKNRDDRKKYEQWLAATGLF